MRTILAMFEHCPGFFTHGLAEAPVEARGASANESAGELFKRAVSAAIQESALAMDID